MGERPQLNHLNQLNAMSIKDPLQTESEFEAERREAINRMERIKERERTANGTQDIKQSDAADWANARGYTDGQKGLTEIADRLQETEEVEEVQLSYPELRHTTADTGYRFPDGSVVRIADCWWGILTPDADGDYYDHAGDTPVEVN